MFKYSGSKVYDIYLKKTSQKVNNMLEEKIVEACRLAKQLDGSIRIDGPDSDSPKWLVDFATDDGLDSDMDQDEKPTGSDESLIGALEEFIDAAKKQLNGDDDEDDDDDIDDEDED